MAVTVDEVLRRLDGGEARQRASQLWKRAHGLKQASQTIEKAMYLDLLRWSARSIMHKLDETHAADECWATYRDVFTEAMLSFGTHVSDRILWHCERVFTLVLEYPTTPRDLFCEYLLCLSAQRHQREASFAGRPPPDRPPPECPKLDADSNAIAIVPSTPADEARRFLDALPERLTFALRHGVVRLRLANPLPVPPVHSLRGGYRCDTCHVAHLFVAYEAMLYDDEAGCVRSTAQLQSARNIVGFDMCVACALHFFRDASVQLTHALRAPSRRVRLGSADVRVLSAAVRDGAVRAVVRLAPWEARPMAWLVEKGAERPPPAWREGMSAVSENRYAPSGEDGRSAEDVCPVCLQPLANGLPVLKTTCAHWFHVECMQEMQRMLADECPLCRHKDAMPAEAEAEAAIQRNTYCLILRAPVPCETKGVMVAVGALLTSSGEYENPTNLAACVTVLCL